MAEVPGYVVDASVASKWHLRDELYVEPAMALLSDFREGRAYLTAPDFIRHEVANAILKASRRSGRERLMSFEVGRRAVEVFLSWGLILERSDSLVTDAYSIAGRLGCSYYDGLSLALAESTRTPFIYADDKLRRNIQGRFGFGLWIEDYSPLSI